MHNMFVDVMYVTVSVNEQTNSPSADIDKNVFAMKVPLGTPG